jgi:uncharacterized protein (TIGR04222 family)
MGYPWGLSDADFLGIYAAGIAAMLLLPVAFWGVIRHAPHRGRARQLDPYRMAYLVGGPERLAEMIIVAHVESGTLRVDSKGRLSKTGAAVTSGPYAAAVAELPNGVNTAGARKRIQADPGMENVARSLQSQGLMIPKSQVAAFRRTSAVGIAVVLPTGLVLLAAAATVYLGLLFTLNIVIGFWVSAFALISPPRVTGLGAAYLRQLRAAHKARGLFAAAPASGAAVGSRSYLPVTADADEGALSGVALLGFSGMQDRTLRRALLAGLSSSSGSLNRYSSSSSTGCGADGGGGHSCGGHGCGHGCGGHGCGGI